MRLPLEFHPAIENEVDEAHRWYEERRVGLGQDFLNQLERTLDEIKKNPSRFGFAEGDIREGQLKRFPFAVYYRVLTDRIRILAVYHTARNPAGWQSRV